ncbi:Phr family secreted Rap phosphatase inhibitor [Bacillus cytotoxicus]|uniref:Phr family secreted Rap phosphatase inhibitor n=1 Tax=Bacillus cytotoxicus TaxID=580165 RepID=A0AAX2CGV5_9BACI|nr:MULTISPECIES: Phr family secreted Rap phosphatase inhibitor [Bacillus cereus group]MDH2880303.1 Phr family secreted Rap phosphatase inhibitor [Bacillus cytotoxicus]QTR69311.1 Phr family secreted Rap phosphatase inhibitor [Bacillus cytotoxicus]QTR78011.1 Phr family secreted Rap phosphatase inhibitor [Bacillus cytotoxicus]QTR82170.1 Phr family secreted Rap phosphatase inhibitor [Bacillus cytotoxicus]QTR85908.1 Phr family secreted Rap phosphatase inhibitor [Bacillus cytotoxicus]
MKKTFFGLVGIITVLTLMFGAQSPAETQKAIDAVQYAHGNHGG